MKNIKKTLKQLDSIPLPEKDKILSFNGEYESESNPIAQPSRSGFARFVPLYATLAFILVFALGFVFLNGKGIFSEKSDYVADVGVRSEPSEEADIAEGVDVSVAAETAAVPVAVESAPVATRQPLYDPNDERIASAAVSPTEASRIALDKVGGGTVIELEPDWENGVMVYEITVFYNNEQYKLEIDAQTGEIIKYNYRRNEQYTYSDPLITQAEAEEIALQRAGGGTVIDFDIDTKKGKTIYGIEVYNDGYEYKFKIDAATGEIIKESSKRTNMPTDANGNAAGAQITMEEAQQIALAEVAHYGEGIITDSEIDTKKGMLIYEIEIFCNGVEYEVEIDALTGGIIEFEIDD